MTNTPKTLVRRTPWPEGSAVPVGTPLQPSVVYDAGSPDGLDAIYDGDAQGYTYAREGHPNADVLAGKIDGMEGAEGGIILSSGMAAVTAVVLGLLGQGDHIVAGDQLYGRSLRLLTQDLPRWGIEATLTDAGDLGAVEAALRPATKMILIELVSNPTLRVADLHGLARLAQDRGILFVVDNTFTTPRAFQPFDHGADVVIHSVTKLLAGHSDVTLGYAVARDANHRKAIYDLATTMGLTGSPFDCWLAERGLYSFDLRYDRAEENAKALAAFLGDHPKVERVIYPGRSDHPDADRAKALLGARTGNMVSFEIAPSRAAANAFAKGCANIVFAPTLGDIGTTLSHPPSSSHRALSPEARAAMGISEGFFRVSVGVEPIDLLISEIDVALNALA
ncbi:cystathionine gamma-synthase [Actibacterium mucosum KCTC 23349]|uniref:Cystathionine gamma-synthase n=1 Tax=Actibacterium mucosum KCTC 23349 TaxID=1454373 RepID=A0A037ZMP6_9RHOB|nr:aminotransferase class I/II-fold pyridoxal phosphate-dependent enzyme [Actibacterium mucosum]KAJ56828.1 cystathionine gamma-synthase [Actibacterium mucosum KCTC 23349]